MTVWLLVVAVPFLTILIIAVVAYLGFRYIAGRIEWSMGNPPRHTFWEVLFTLRAHSLLSLLLTLQRAHTPQPAEHAMGSRPKVDWLDYIGFDPATFAPMPQDQTTTVDLTVTIGPIRPRPVTVSMPVLIAPMGYGIGLAAETKVALAQASSLAGIATATGEGAYLPEERAYAARWILQEGRGAWSHQAPVRSLADMIQLQWGQASEGGATVTKDPSELPFRMWKAAGKDEAVIKAAPYESVSTWVNEVRLQCPDIPIGIKIPATQHVEEDLAYLVTLPIDVVTLDGSEAGSAGSPAVVSDHFGIATALAVHRAHQWLTQTGLREHITLLVSGGIRGAADMARLVALGADAVWVGSEPLIAALHGQVSDPWVPVPPAQLVFARSSVNRAPRLDVGQASEQVANWLEATRSELKTIMRTLGLTTLNELRRARPLIARTQAAANVFGLPFDGDIPNPSWNASLEELTASYSVLNQVLLVIGQNVGAWNQRVDGSA